MAKRYLPHDLQPWATDAAFPAGSDPWSGQPTKVAPAAAVAAAGHIPNRRVPAIWENFYKSRLTDAAMVSAYQALNSWRRLSFPTFSTYPDLLGPFVSNINGTEIVPDTNLCFVIGDSADWGFALGATDWSSVTELTGVTQAPGAIPCANGEYGDRLVWGASGDRDIGYWPLSGAQQLSASVAPVGFGFGALHMSHDGSKRLLAGIFGAGSNTQRIYTSDNGGATWTARSTPAGWSTTNILNFADNGAGVILATGSRDSEILRSADNGLTWSAVSVPFTRGAGTDTACYGLAYNEVHGLFMITRLTAGGCAVSSAGSAWTSRSGSPSFGLPNSLSTNTRHVLAASGPVFAHVYNRDASGGTGYDRRGIAFTLDAGLSWRFAAVGNPQNDTNPLYGIAALNGGFVAWTAGSGNAAYYSAPTHLPDAPAVFT